MADGPLCSVASLTQVVTPATAESHLKRQNPCNLVTEPGSGYVCVNAYALNSRGIGDGHQEVGFDSEQEQQELVQWISDQGEVEWVVTIEDGGVLAQPQQRVASEQRLIEVERSERQAQSGAPHEVDVRTNEVDTRTQ
jgi:hypothetical protein